jgi:hypothetical protein
VPAASRRPERQRSRGEPWPPPFGQRRHRAPPDLLARLHALPGRRASGERRSARRFGSGDLRREARTAFSIGPAARAFGDLAASRITRGGRALQRASLRAKRPARILTTRTCS